MCGNADCPKTHDLIICELCGLWYPAGGARCRNQFKRWLKTEPEVQRLHREYLEQEARKRDNP